MIGNGSEYGFFGDFFQHRSKETAMMEATALRKTNRVKLVFAMCPWG